MDDLDLNLVVAELQQACLDSLSRALNVRLDDDVQRLHVALLHMGKQILQSDGAAEVLHLGILLGLLPLLGQLTGHTLVGYGVEGIACLGNLCHTDDLHRYGGAGGLDGSAAIVGHSADTSHRSTGDDHVALLQGTVLHQQGRYGAAALVETRLNDGAGSLTVGVGLQLAHFCGEDNHLQQLLHAHTGLCGNLAHDGVAAVFLGDQVVLHDLLLDPLRVCAGQIHLVDGNDDRDLRSLGMVDGLHGLGHDAVVRCHHQNCNVGAHSAAGTHGGKCLMAGGIQEGDGAAIHVYLISADGLGNAACLAGSNMGLPHVVEKAGLTVVNVTHDYNNGGAIFQLVLGVHMVVDQALLSGDDNFLLHLAAHFLGNNGGSLVVDDL